MSGHLTADALRVGGLGLSRHAIGWFPGERLLAGIEKERFGAVGGLMLVASGLVSADQRPGLAEHSRYR